VAAIVHPAGVVRLHLQCFDEDDLQAGGRQLVGEALVAEGFDHRQGVGLPAEPENLESWLTWREAGERPAPGYVEDELRGYLECGILCFGFARARCTCCGQGFVVAFSRKGRGVCPSCNGRDMAQTAAHLADHIIPPVPVRQWVNCVPKRRRSRQRLRGMLADGLRPSQPSRRSS
jgi:hypothetical protein